MLQKSVFCRFLFQTPSDVIRRSVGLPSGGLLAAWTPSRTPPESAESPVQTPGRLPPPPGRLPSAPGRVSQWRFRPPGAPFAVLALEVLRIQRNLSKRAWRYCISRPSTLRLPFTAHLSPLAAHHSRIPSSHKTEQKRRSVCCTFSLQRPLVNSI